MFVTTETLARFAYRFHASPERPVPRTPMALGLPAFRSDKDHPVVEVEIGPSGDSSSVPVSIDGGGARRRGPHLFRTPNPGFL